MVLVIVNPELGVAIRGELVEKAAATEAKRAALAMAIAPAFATPLSRLKLCTFSPRSFHVPDIPSSAPADRSGHGMTLRNPIDPPALKTMNLQGIVRFRLHALPIAGRN